MRILNASKVRAPVRLMVLVNLLVVGCATTKSTSGTPHPVWDKTLLEFLQDGVTDRQAVLTKLGRPSCCDTDNGKYVFYPIAGSSRKGYYLADAVISPDAAYSLVLVFDEQGVLKKHSLVKIR